MRTTALTLAAAGAVALSTLAFTPKPAQAATYSTTLEFSGQVVADTCQVVISQYNVGNPVDLSVINGQTLPIPLDDEFTFQFDSNGGHTTNRQAQTITISGCPSAISQLVIGWTQAASTWNGNGVLSNVLTGQNASTNVGIKVSSNTGSGWQAVDFANGGITLDMTGTSAQFQLGAQFYTATPGSADAGKVKADVGMTITYQ